MGMDIYCREVRPFAPLIISEICFWLTIMKDHSLLIYLGLPCDQCELKEESQKFYNVFEDLERRACEVRSGEDFSCLVELASMAVKKLFAFKRHLLHLMIECKLCGGCIYPLTLDHMAREALYFCKLLGKMFNGDMPFQVDAMVSENVFWLKIMADHLKFIRGMLDPSERRLGEQPQVLSDKFDELELHAQDFESMLWHYRPNNDFVRFEKDVTDATISLKNYHVTAEAIIKECNALSTVPPLLADHTRRETEHFLAILELIREALLHCDGSSVVACDYDD
jgi:hypothetical protein